ncbi:urease accessory protein [Nakamurella sp. UYEF19]|uniref:urease accessory protein UreD n=1 Tax=Nakamurella sp. UYEF19 TaxID=1756392 RepID=UPI003396A7F2
MTSVGVEVGEGRARLSLTAGNLAPRLIGQDNTGAKVALVATTALLLGGDVVDLQLRVGPGAWLEIVETAGTVAYDAQGVASVWHVRATVEDGGLLLWHGEPFVVADGANTLRRSVFDLGDGAVLCTRETVVLGRTGESGGAVRIHNTVRRGPAAVLVEDLDLTDPSTRSLPGIIGPSRVLDTLTLIGAAAPVDPPVAVGSRFELQDGVGTVGRVLRSDLARSPVPLWWKAWSTAARTANAGSSTATAR